VCVMLFGVCFTFNNWSAETKKACQKAIGQAGILYIIWGEEVGEEGTPHLQGYIQCNQDKYKRLMRVIGTCHMEKQKGTSDEARDYCKKDGIWQEHGIYKFIDAPKKRQGERSDLLLVKKSIDEGMSYDDICEKHFAIVGKYSRFIKERVQARDSKTQETELQEKFVNSSLRPWQQKLLDITATEACPRKIHWIWEDQGNVGKSFMTTYLGVMKGSALLTAGKKADMAYIYAQKPSKIVCFDLARTNEEYLDGVYSLAEDLKNGRVVSTKYESKTAFFKPPHVFVFANFLPNMKKWSADRYDIIDLKHPCNTP